MPPKKRDKELDGQKLPRIDPVQADHELFLQAFEKPTQIYRFLRTRNQMSPIFLNRNLSYMRERMSRSHKSRRGFRIDTLLDIIMAKNNINKTPSVQGYMTLTFLGFYDKKIEGCQDPVKVETLLLKICHKKRKDVSSPIMQVSVGTSEVPINPSENQPPPKAPTVSIPNESFSLNNGHLAKTYMLLLRVHCMTNNNNSCNNNNCELETEPAQKKRKLSTGSYKNGNEEVKLYGSELTVYDKHNRCLLSDGDYELGLQEVQANVRSSPKKHSSWESVPEITECKPFEVFSSYPKLKFRLNWTTEPSNGLVDRPTLIQPLPNNDNKENRPGELERLSTNNNNNSNNNNTNNSNNNNNSTMSNSSPLLLTRMPSNNSVEKIDTTGTQQQQIVYQFLYNNNSRQQTEACEDLHCPWCSLDCGKLYSLLKHLKLCHSRFTFTYVPIAQGARIDVAINECYDGSYAGSPHELISQPSGVTNSKTGPTRRTSVTNIVVCHPKRPKPSLSEFLELDENEFESQRPYITGHNRLYHHTVTCLPIYPKEMDVDSEGENDPRWLQTKTMMMIDDFTDVNEGEKELMKMWNLHVMKHGYVGDCQIPIACHMFLEKKGKELLMKNLYRNFVLHMSSLFDFGLISPVALYQILQKLQDIMKIGGEDNDVRKVLQKSHELQVEHWVKTGVHQTSDNVKINNTCAKTNFNNEILKTNARRKTTITIGSPPPSSSSSSSTISSSLSSSSSSTTTNAVKNINNNINKHISINSTKNTNNFTTVQNTQKTNISNGNVTIKKNDEICIKIEDTQKAFGNDAPARRKSTNTVSQNCDNNSAPLRRKSMANDNNSSNEFHKRKLVLDIVPAGNVVNPKLSQNNDH
ncbi:polycomb protein suz12-B isoform X2 [Aphidius gifuensis]|uniref:polycomb protein suz12-B isoform X2 n=1 Tax=Aphidius gifuensis TaxID=684658 RepID=UPI001CDCEA1D|nr:polycomb protein suz12-B isoform X2 [Aphidius gifuensis]